jgi:hypothetical protein
MCRESVNHRVCSQSVMLLKNNEVLSWWQLQIFLVPTVIASFTDIVEN